MAELPSATAPKTGLGRWLIPLILIACIVAAAAYEWYRGGLSNNAEPARTVSDATDHRDGDKRDGDKRDGDKRVRGRAPQSSCQLFANRAIADSRTAKRGTAKCFACSIDGQLGRYSRRRLGKCGTR